jgi:glycosyltransferase involved in cell wall biosynthesis
MRDAGVSETGEYRETSDALGLLADMAPDCIFLPSIWPETFSYTLSMAFGLGIRPVVFDIGAPAERVRANGFGEVLPFELINDISGLNDRLIMMHATSDEDVSTSLSAQTHDRPPQPREQQGVS